MLRMVRRNLGAALRARTLLREKGFGPIDSLRRLTLIGAARAYRRLAAILNQNRLFASSSRARLRRAYPAQSASPGAGHFCIIVMPGTLHFLVPCLALLPASLPVVLVINGAPAWELALLERLFPHLHVSRLMTLPRSSLPHGQVLTLLLETNDRNFGVLDHDFYVLDQRLFTQLEPDDRTSLIAAVAGEDDRGDLYPETFFMFFNVAALRSVMRRHRIDARIYRKLPEHVREALRHAAYDAVRPLKSYHDFFDTLQLVLIVAAAEGLQVRLHEAASQEAMLHVGGTSSGAPETKPLLSAFAALKMIELLDDDTVRARYAPRYGRFHSAAELAARIPKTPENVARMWRIEAIVKAIEPHLARGAARQRDAARIDLESTA